MADIEVKGLKELEKKLIELGKYSDKILSQSLRKAANVVRDEAQKNAPYDPKPNEKRDKKTGKRGERAHIRENIKVRRDPNPKRKGKSEIMYIKPFYTKKKNTWYWWLHEFGSVKTKGTRFMTKSLFSKASEAIQVFKTDMARKIILATKRMNKK